VLSVSAALVVGAASVGSAATAGSFSDFDAR
jgi:hypothetical protein